MKKVLILLGFIFLIYLIRFFFILDIDEIYAYGFSYNIASGLIPYKNFNMILGPLYSFLFSIPMYFFGNYYFLFKITHCLFYGLIFTFLYHKMGKNVLYLLMLFLSSYCVFSYNYFIAFLVILILFLNDSNYNFKDILIGILIGMILMTKQNIGIYLLISYFYINRSNLIKSFLYVLIPILPVFLYLLVNNCLFEYFDFCFLGLKSFTSNFYFDVVSLFILLIFIFSIVKCYIKLKHDSILYIISFFLLVFPIIDIRHIMPVVFVFAYYIFINNYNLKYYKIFIIIIFSFSLIGGLVSSLYKEVLFNNTFLKYEFFPKYKISYLNYYKKYLDESNADYVYVFNVDAYIIRLYRDDNPDFYDLINRGNLGTNKLKYIETIDKTCKDKKCIFILDKYFFDKSTYYNQLDDSFIEYVRDNNKYHFLEELDSGDIVYTN